ncbi:MAG: hypothetical protein LBL62_07350 [Planctomycetaceae bacterium]|jgi:hypothetical protein|nr:hypothetical protein [Planctomycetaceae bacterium]
MKPNKKKKFDISLFFIENVEKIVLVLVIPLAIYIAYLGTQYEPLAWQPDALVKAADNANNTIKTSERKAVDEGVSIITYDVKATWIKAKIRSEYYRTETQWLPSLFPEKNKRSAVNVLPVKELKAQAGLGAVSINPSSPLVSAAETGNTGSSAMTGNSGTGARIGERWAIITGLIPIKQQLNLYIDKFSSSVLPDALRDMPTYILYDVERAEVIPGKNPDDLEWKRLDFLTEFLQKRSLWSGNAAVDPVDPAFFAPQVPGKFPMAYPLPPVTKKFNEEVAHPPFIPMLTDSQMEVLKQSEKINERLRKEMFDIKPEDILDSPFGGSENRIGSSGSTGSSGMDGNTQGRNRRLRRDAEQEEEEIKPVLVDSYLFRFLDFKVEPGKTYRYRVRLYLANPNYRLAPNFLEDETLSKEPYLVTEFSAPSNMVTIPLESRVLTTDVFAIDPKQPWTEPAASIMAVHFDLADGSEWYVEKGRVYRGSTINYKRQDVTNPLLEKQTTTLDMESGGSSPPSRTPPRGSRPTTPPSRTRTEPKATGKQLDIVSEVCVLDMKGGEALYKVPTAAQKAPDLKSPGRVMVLEPSGNILIRTVKIDLTEAETIKNPTAVNNFGSGSMDYMRSGMEN